jgi:hypothetical protein
MAGGAPHSPQEQTQADLERYLETTPEFAPESGPEDEKRKTEEDQPTTDEPTEEPTDEPTDEPTEEPPIVEEEEDPPDAAAEAEDEITSLSGLAEAFDATEDVILDSIQVPGRGEGAAPITLRAALEGYQQAPETADVTASPEYQAKIGELEATRTELQAAHDAKIMELQAALEGLVEEQANDPSPEELAKLKDEDPVAYLQHRDKVATRREKFQRGYDKLTREAARRQQEAEETDRRYQGEQFGELMRRKPEWKDEKVGVAASQQIRTSLLAVGYTPAEIDGLVDARAIETAWKASEYDRLHSKKKGKPTGTLKKLRDKKLPEPNTSIKASARRGARRDGKSKRARQMGRLRKTGSVEDAMPLLMDLVED